MNILDPSSEWSHTVFVTLKAVMLVAVRWYYTAALTLTFHVSSDIENFPLENSLFKDFACGKEA